MSNSYHPIHYDCHNSKANPEIDCINTIKAMLTDEEYRGYLKGSILNYVWREKFKNGLEDVEKAKVYVEFLLDFLR